MLFFHPFIGFTTDTLKHLIISTLAPSIWQGRVVPIFATTLYTVPLSWLLYSALFKVQINMIICGFNPFWFQKSIYLTNDRFAPYYPAYSWGGCSQLCFTILLTVCQLPCVDGRTSTWLKLLINMTMSHCNYQVGFQYFFLSSIPWCYQWQI